MQTPLQISFHGIHHSDAVEERIREKVTKLEQLFNRITRCRVVVRPHKNTNPSHIKGEPFTISLDLTVPGAELVVKRVPKDTFENEDIFVALREAFASMERQLRDYVARRSLHDDMKTRAAKLSSAQ